MLLQFMSFAKCAIYLTNIYVVRKEESLPTWERGLKQKGDGQGGNGDYVAPHVGAWIETHRRLLSTVRETVAPHVGAWIETR